MVPPRLTYDVPTSEQTRGISREGLTWRRLMEEGASMGSSDSAQTMAETTRIFAFPPFDTFKSPADPAVEVV